MSIRTYDENKTKTGQIKKIRNNGFNINSFIIGDFGKEGILKSIQQSKKP